MGRQILAFEDFKKLKKDQLCFLFHKTVAIWNLIVFENHSNESVTEKQLNSTNS